MPFVVDVQRSLLPQTLSNYPTIICLLNILFEKCEKKLDFLLHLRFLHVVTLFTRVSNFKILPKTVEKIILNFSPKKIKRVQ